jgi:hypothetical protein
MYVLLTAEPMKDIIDASFVVAPFRMVHCFNPEYVFGHCPLTTVIMLTKTTAAYEPILLIPAIGAAVVFSVVSIRNNHIQNYGPNYFYNHPILLTVTPSPSGEFPKGWFFNFGEFPKGWFFNFHVGLSFFCTPRCGLRNYVLYIQTSKYGPNYFHNHALCRFVTCIARWPLAGLEMITFHNHGPRTGRNTPGVAV